MYKKSLNTAFLLLLAGLMVLALFPMGTLAAEGSLNIDLIVVEYAEDEWQILYPEGNSTSTTVPYDGDAPTLYDAMLAVDEGAQLDEWGYVERFLSHDAGSDGMWACMLNESAQYSAHTSISSGDKVLFYYGDFMTPAPEWDRLAAIIETGVDPGPGGGLDPEEQLNNLLAAELTFEKIKGSNTAADQITANLGSLPTSLDSYALSVAWESSNTAYLSNSGTLRARPQLGQEPVPVTMTATVTAGYYPNPAKYGENPSQTVEIALEIAPLTQEEQNASILAVQNALNDMELDCLKLIDGDELDPDNVLYDISLADPRQYGDKNTDYLPDGHWSSDKPGVIDVNGARGKVTRPGLGEEAVTVTLTVIASKMGYQESKDFTVTVQPVTQLELDAANAELDAVAEAVTFDVIKKGNTSPQAVNSGLQMVYRGLGYPGEITWQTSNNGDAGIKIEWESNDAGTLASYGTVNRPTVSDREVLLTATLSAFRLSAHLEKRTVEIPVVVRKVSESANVTNIITAPSMNMVFEPETKTYNLIAPAIAQSVGITVEAEESGTLICSGEYSGYGALTFEIPLEDETEIIITTHALDSDATETYTLNIEKEEEKPLDAAAGALLAALAEGYQNTASDWAAMALAAYGKGHQAAGAEIIENARQTYEEGGITDLSRTILTLTALGVNAQHVYGGSESLYLDFLAQLDTKTPNQALEGIFALLALDSGAYADGENFSRQGCIDFILNKKLTLSNGQIAWSIVGTSADTDTTAMAIAALAPYYSSHPNVKAAVDGALAYLAAQQQSGGHFGNSNVTAMVMVALAAQGIDAAAIEGDFAPGGKSLLEGLLSFKTAENKFGYKDNQTANSLSTEQGFRGLVAYQGYVYAGGAYSVYQFGPQTGDGTDLTGESDPGLIPPDPNAPKTLKVRVEDLYHGDTLIPETTVTLSGTHMDALKAALTAHGKNPETDLSQSMGAVSSILGVSGDSTVGIGWMYAVNGEIPYTALIETQVAEDDMLVLFFINYFEPFYFTTFDKTDISLKKGESVTLTLTGIDPWAVMGDGAVYGPIAGATVYAYDAAGQPIGSEAISDAQGKATLSFSEAGDYTISAHRAGGINITDLVPPLCRVRVTSTSNPNPGDPSDGIRVSFTLQGMDENNTQKTWISKKTLNNMAVTTTVKEAILKALEGTGYTAHILEQSGYLKSITTPEGFTLAEAHGDMPNSGWMYRVNNKLLTVGIEEHTLKNGDHILLFFSKDFTKEKDGKDISGSSTDSAPAEEAAGTAPPFADMKPNDWFYDAVEYVFDHGLMQGVGENQFDPHGHMTRAMLVTVLYRYEGQPQTAGENIFADAADGQWYTKAIIWANEQGIIEGYGNGLFGTGDKITREQAAAILMRYAEWKKQDISKNQALAAYADADAISPWALTAMEWANAEGLITGVSAEALDPAGSTTRGQIAAILMRFIEDYLK